MAAIGSPTASVFVPILLAARDPALVLPTIGQALGVRRHCETRLTRRPARRVAPADRQMLLMLDNCEQVIEAAAADLRRCLATHARTLTGPGDEPCAAARCAGEHEYPDPAAGAARTGTVADGRRARASADAVRSSSSGPGRSKPAFALTERQRARRGRHLPEAGWTAPGDRAGRKPGEILSPGALLEHLDRPPVDPHRRTAGPARGSRPCEIRLPGATTCSRSTNNAFLRRLAVFVGGFTLEAAEAVAGLRSASPASMCWKASPRWSIRACCGHGPS